MERWEWRFRSRSLCRRRWRSRSRAGDERAAAAGVGLVPARRSVSARRRGDPVRTALCRALVPRPAAPAAGPAPVRGGAGPRVARLARTGPGSGSGAMTCALAPLFQSKLDQNRQRGSALLVTLLWCVFAVMTCFPSLKIASWIVSIIFTCSARNFTTSVHSSDYVAPGKN